MQKAPHTIFKHSLYDPRFEHDACGIGFVARIDGRPDHEILSMALMALGNQRHRGAVASDAKTGDGSGVLTQLPRRLLLRDLAAQGVEAAADDLALGMLFLPTDDAAAAASRRVVEHALTVRGLRVLAWRDVPINAEGLGQRAMETLPLIQQVIIGKDRERSEQEYERVLFLARKAIEAEWDAQGLTAYIPSFSARTVVYKGLLLGDYLRDFYCDLADSDFETALAVYHQRYSTNTFPTWERAQPFRMVSHNGEINTLQGNYNWMRSRERAVHFPDVPGLTGDLAPEVVPVLDASGSDSAILDNVLELLVQGGRDVRHALTMMVPEAWEQVPDMSPEMRAFYRYHACLMEPWDGPAALTFSDGHIVGTTLDRNGLRPARYRITEDGIVISGSEAGVVDLADRRIIQKGRLGPGQMIAVDTANGAFHSNVDLKQMLAARQPYSEWVQQHLVTLDLNSPPNGDFPAIDAEQQTAQQMAFGYTSEELSVVLKPMMRDGSEPVGSMGDDTPLAVLTEFELGRPLFQFFKQRFAEVTNPPMDPLREELVMSLSVNLGSRGQLLGETPEHAHLLNLKSPFLTDAQLAHIREIDDPRLRPATISIVMPLQAGANGTSGEQALRSAVERVCQDAEQAAREGAALLILSDRGVDAAHAPIPSLLALGAVHHHLIRAGLRSRVSLIVETGEAREVHHVACLLGYGAKAVNPYLALESVRTLAESPQRGSRNAKRNGSENGSEEQEHDPQAAMREAETNYIKALEKGLRKIMSKMGISPLESYCGAQIFEALGLDQDLVQQCFTGTTSRLGGISFEKLARDVQTRHQRAFGAAADEKVSLPHPGFYKYKKGGEHHAYSPQVIHASHKAARHEMQHNGAFVTVMDTTHETFLQGYGFYRAYAELVENRPPTEIRDLLEMQPAGDPVPLEEVEPIESILKRFSTAAMSHGSTSSEAHENLAIAMNRLGGMSNSGEGGEATERFRDERNSKIKQVASGRFGVTPTYLAHADELQIKMAQGSKPGEGGHLPGHKVSAEIARIRHTTPGVSLISPPPHHDIYSIEDLAQLIYDLKQVNEAARVSVKLVATAGVGTVAAGVAKGYADGILISGHAGGTGASPLSSIKNAGVSWELGLAETQQTLVINGLRGRVRLRADGGFQTGRDVLMAALLGADEFSFGTTALVAEGCLMARACHANTCPVGIATQRPDLRAKFPGTPEMVMAFFRYVAQEVRELLASLGLRSLDEAVGRTDLLRQHKTGVLGADMLDLRQMLVSADELAGQEIRHNGQRNPLPPVETLNDQILRDAQSALAGSGPIELNYRIRNCERTVGARLAGTIGQMYGEKGLPEGTVNVTLRGSAGQSFGAFNAPGMHMLLIGEANDYVGKGMAGGEIAIRPPEEAPFTWCENVIAGNTILYGATGGELYLAGRVGERFAVRNSGATAVVEGLGDHGCEYMTGGTVVVLGATGYNFGAGMTGGVAYVLDEQRNLEMYHNPQLVQLDRLNAQDELAVQTLVQRHLELTGSPRAAEILERWDEFQPQFWRVMPREAVAKIEAASEGAASDGTASPKDAKKEPVAA
jgi:glutamate synthase (ferredoxin)